LFPLTIANQNAKAQETPPAATTDTMKYFSTFSLALLTVLFTKTKARPKTKKVDMVMVEIDTTNLTSQDEAFWLDFAGDELLRTTTSTTTTRRLASSSHSNLRGTGVGDERKLQTTACKRCWQEHGQGSTYCAVRHAGCGRMLGQVVSEEEEERELSLFANMDDYVCIAMGGEGRRNMRQAATANGKRPAHSFTSPDAAPDNAQEYLCFEKETA
jgi:hypothetical protein